MKVFLCVFALFAVAAAQKCTKEDEVKEAMKPVLKECLGELKEKILALPKEQKAEEIGKCMLKKQDMITAEDKLDYPKYKDESKKYLTTEKADEVLKKMDSLWEEANGDCKTFFKNLHAAWKTMCPEDKLCAGMPEE